MTATAELAEANIAERELDAMAFKPHQGVWVYDPRLVPFTIRKIFERLDDPDETPKEWVAHISLTPEDLINLEVNEVVAADVAAHVDGSASVNTTFYNKRKLVLIRASNASYGRETNSGPKILILNAGRPFEPAPGSSQKDPKKLLL